MHQLFSNKWDDYESDDESDRCFASPHTSYERKSKQASRCFSGTSVIGIKYPSAAKNLIFLYIFI